MGLRDLLGADVDSAGFVVTMAEAAATDSPGEAPLIVSSGEVPFVCKGMGTAPPPPLPLLSRWLLKSDRPSSSLKFTDDDSTSSSLCTELALALRAKLVQGEKSTGTKDVRAGAGPGSAAAMARAAAMAAEAAPRGMTSTLAYTAGGSKSS